MLATNSFVFANRRAQSNQNLDFDFTAYEERNKSQVIYH